MELRMDEIIFEGPRNFQNVPFLFFLQRQLCKSRQFEMSIEIEEEMRIRRMWIVHDGQIAPKHLPAAATKTLILIHMSDFKKEVGKGNIWRLDTFDPDQQHMPMPIQCSYHTSLDPNKFFFCRFWIYKTEGFELLESLSKVRLWFFPSLSQIATWHEHVSSLASPAALSEAFSDERTTAGG